MQAGSLWIAAFTSQGLWHEARGTHRIRFLACNSDHCLGFRGFIGWMFLLAGLMFAFVGMIRQDVSWPLVGLGAFSFAFGWWCWIAADREYKRAKAEEKLSRD